MAKKNVSLGATYSLHICRVRLAWPACVIGQVDLSVLPKTLAHCKFRKTGRLHCRRNNDNATSKYAEGTKVDQAKKWLFYEVRNYGKCQEYHAQNTRTLQVKVQKNWQASFAEETMIMPLQNMQKEQRLTKQRSGFFMK